MMLKKIKGFTLIELLVVIAVIGILSVIVISSIQDARLRAQDAAVTANLSQFRTQVELDYPNGDYTDLCSSETYLDLVTLIEDGGGYVDICDANTQDFIVIATLPSGSNQTSLVSNTAYAQNTVFSGDLLMCTNTNGRTIRTTPAEFNAMVEALQGITDENFNRDIISPFCNPDEAKRFYPDLVITIPGENQEDDGESENGDSQEDESTAYQNIGWTCQDGTAVCGGFISDTQYDVLDSENCQNTETPMAPPSCAPVGDEGTPTPSNDGSLGSYCVSSDDCNSTKLYCTTEETSVCDSPPASECKRNGYILECPDVCYGTCEEKQKSRR